jgi:hypothetical protein
VNELPFFDKREDAWDWLEREYGGATIDGDPEWAADMIEALTDREQHEWERRAAGGGTPAPRTESESRDPETTP